MVPSFRTLRFKIAGAFLLWTAVFLVAVALLVPLGRDVYVARVIDGDLANRAAMAAAKLADGSAPADLVKEADGITGTVGVPGGTTVLLRVRTANGEVAAASPRLAGVSLPLPAGGAGAGPPAVVTLPGAAEGSAGAELGRLRVLTARVGEGTGGWLVDVAYPMRTSDAMGAVIRSLLLLALIPGMLGAGLAGWIVSKSIARRLDAVAHELRAVSASRLGERVRLAGDTGDEIGAMVTEINAMLDRLAATFQGMEQFMSEVSHELKTPVAALLAEAQVMKYQAPTAETARQFILSVEEEMRRLGKLVESFLMLARFEHGRRYLAEGAVSLNDVVLESVEHSTRMATQAGVGLGLNLYDAGESAPEATVRGDAELLRIVFDNLIRNAVQFSDRGSAVSVDVGMFDSTLAVAVRDRGPGAPPEYINRIFERFVQAPGQKPGRRGTGLGLAIAKGVVELHSGTIEAHNHPEGGCVFTVKLPLMRGNQARPHSAGAGAAAGAAR